MSASGKFFGAKVNGKRRTFAMLRRIFSADTQDCFEDGG
jgi:hypothetical protein